MFRSQLDHNLVAGEGRVILRVAYGYSWGYGAIGLRLVTVTDGEKNFLLGKKKKRNLK